MGFDVAEIDERAVHVRVTGPLALAATLAQLERLAQDHPGRNRLWDFRAADFSRVTREEMLVLADASKSASPPRRVAALVARDLEFGVARMFEALADRGGGPQYAVFRDEAEALRWLGVED